jgi:hypothetical protein
MEAFVDRLDLGHTLGLWRMILAGRDSDRARVRRQARPLADQVDQLGQPVKDEKGRKRRIPDADDQPEQGGLRSDEAAEMVDPRHRTLLHDVGFFILGSVYVEAFGVLFDPKFHIPFVGRWPALGFLQDFFAVAVLAGIIVFAIIRLRSSPRTSAARRGSTARTPVAPG